MAQNTPNEPQSITGRLGRRPQHGLRITTRHPASPPTYLIPYRRDGHPRARCLPTQGLDGLGRLSARPRGAGCKDAGPVYGALESTNDNLHLQRQNYIQSVTANYDPIFYLNFVLELLNFTPFQFLMKPQTKLRTRYSSHG